MIFDNKQRKREKIKNRFGKNPLEESFYYNAADRLNEVGLYHEELEGNASGLLDQVTWNDLEMDQVFLRINHTASFVGEQVLYYQLHDLNRFSREEDGISYEKKLNYFKNEEDKRAELEERLLGIGKNKGDYYLPKFLMHTDFWKVGNERIFHILQLLLAFFLITAIAFQKPIFIGGLILIVVCNFLIYQGTRHKYEAFLMALGRFKQIYDFAAAAKKDKEIWELLGSEEVAKSLDKLSGMSKNIVSYNSRKFGAMTGEFVAIFYDYLWGITLWDIALFNRMMRIIANKKDEVLALYEFAGSVDGMISVASYRESLKKEGFCIPAFFMDNSNRKDISSMAMYHPLLNKPVANDFSIEKRAVITGANASGKSTFMKALAINVILAETIHTALAKSFELKRVYVMTCMSLRDDIESGESYYFREAKYLKRMIDKASEEENILCVIDEILKGTNTRERIAASKAIMEYFVSAGAITLLATHDKELTENPAYSNYFFDCSVVDGDIVFNYKIHRGKNDSTNAIKLLMALGYPKSIVGKAEEYMG